MGSNGEEFWLPIIRKMIYGKKQQVSLEVIWIADVTQICSMQCMNGVELNYILNTAEHKILRANMKTDCSPQVEEMEE